VRHYPSLLQGIHCHDLSRSHAINEVTKITIYPRVQGMRHPRIFNAAPTHLMRCIFPLDCPMIAREHVIASNARWIDCTTAGNFVRVYNCV